MPEYESPTITELLAVTSEDMIALHELIAETNRTIRLFAEKHHTHGSWGAVSSLESAMYYVWGAMGYLARAEGRLGAQHAEPEHHVQLPVEAVVNG
jgi:hypothetical protein